MAPLTEDIRHAAERLVDLVIRAAGKREAFYRTADQFAWYDGVVTGVIARVTEQVSEGCTHEQ